MAKIEDGCHAMEHAFERKAMLFVGPLHATAKVDQYDLGTNTGPDCMVRELIILQQARH